MWYDLGDIRNERGTPMQSTQSQPNPYSAFDVAATIIEVADRGGAPVSNLVLQKMLFLCQREHARAHGRRLFCEDMQAWQYGPIVPAVYHAYAKHGASSIRRAQESWSAIGYGYSLVPVIGLGDEATRLVSEVLSEWRERPGWELNAHVLSPDGPWGRAYALGHGTPIDFGCPVDAEASRAWGHALGDREGAVAAPPAEPSWHYEYERMAVMGTSSGSMLDGHRELIDERARRGDLYAGWLPVVQSEGTIQQVDLVFRVGGPPEGVAGRDL